LVILANQLVLDDTSDHCFGLAWEAHLFVRSTAEATGDVQDNIKQQ
jgi:hypothetical protein